MIWKIQKIKQIQKIKKCSEFIKNYPDIRRCKNEAIKLSNVEYIQKVPGQLGLVNEIIKNPEKHYKGFKEYDDMEEYLYYIIYTTQSVS